MDKTRYNDLLDEVFAEPAWHRTLDFIVVLIIGLLCGAAVAYTIAVYQMGPATETIQIKTPKVQSASQTDDLPKGAKFDNA